MAVPGSVTWRPRESSGCPGSPMEYEWNTELTELAEQADGYWKM